MHRKKLIDQLGAFKGIWLHQDFPTFDRAEDSATLFRFKDFVDEHADCFERSLASGHITASAFVVTADLSRVLLTHHRKLNKWLQLGGHADGESDPKVVALTEVKEESGLSDFEFWPYEQRLKAEPVIPFYFYIHWNPANKNDPPHWHYDLRYLIYTQSPDSICLSDESHALRWFSLEEAVSLNPERSLHRPFEKLVYLRKFCL